jgi:uncharacterized protein (DUF433 family)
VRKNLRFGEAEQAVEMRRAGATVDTIAAKLGVEAYSIERVLTPKTLRCSDPLRAVRKNVSFADKQRIRDMHSAGCTIDAIADAFNVEPDSVVRVLNTVVQTAKLKRREWEGAPPAILEAIRSLWSQGWTIERINKTYKVLPAVIAEMVEGIAQNKKSFRRKVAD